MTLDEIIKEKLDRLNHIPDKLITATEAVQREQYTKLLELLSGLEKEGGMIVRSKANLSAIESIITQLQDSIINVDPDIVTEYEKAVRSFISEMKTQQALTDAYFLKIFPETVIDAGFAADVALASRTQAANLLLGSSADAAFFDPIREQLINAVSSGASYKETVEALKQVVVGDPEHAGAIQSHIKQISHDSFAVADRSYTNALADEQGAVWYSYKGSEIKTTRPFCKERHGKYFHKKEIEAWGKGEKTEGLQWPKGGEWAGKAEGTNAQTIFTWCAGYNCRHNLLPVSILRVPPDVIQRAINEGFYKPAKEDKVR